MFSPACVGVFKESIGLGTGVVDMSGVVAFDCRIDEMVSTAIQLCRVMLYGGMDGSLCQVLRT